jgi:hypothetical protein
MVRVLAAVGMILGTVGCSAVGGMIENYRRESNRTVQAEYVGLEGKSFAVVVSAQRAINAEYPELALTLAERMTGRFADPKNAPRASGYVPAREVQAYQLRHPSWPAKSMADLASELGGVERVVLVEVNEFRLSEPGNQYEWQGSASATVSIAEVDGGSPEEFGFARTVTVAYPDKQGVTTADVPATLVMSALLQRLTDRLCWPMYRHEEPYYPEY